MSCCYLVISHLEHSWQVLKYSTDINFSSSSWNKTGLCSLLILTHATTASMWPLPNKLVLPVLWPSSRPSFLNDVKWTWYLIQPSTRKSLWNRLASNIPKIYEKLDELHLCFLLFVSSTGNIYTYQTTFIFLHPLYLVLELIDPFGLIYTVLNKTSSSTRA